MQQENPDAVIGSLTLAGSRELADVIRNGMVESRHAGAAVVVSPAGVVREIGDSTALIYPRSTLKPVQAIAVMRSGVVLEGEHAVIAAASHSGTAEHRRLALELLGRAGCSEDDLQCPPDRPADSRAAQELSATGQPLSRLAMNCSGKHAAFLLACTWNNWPTAGYLDPEHPLQRLIRATVEEFSSETVRHTGVDGCGAPLFALSLRGLATAYGRIAAAVRAPALDRDASLLGSAILAHPWAIDGHGRANTAVIEHLGLIAKGGAEGVIAMGAPDGTAVAVKILDGSHRAATLVAVELLAQNGSIDRDLADRAIAATTEQVLGGGVPAGAIRISRELS